ncbi:S8 family serine peptidase [Spongiactinospora sp. TRM90649]|uniref:S8 family serine peptidase n=1 Tax=Spongiactinospora sp. TRM90649 TaxID=3031114 RepID=UPI0023F82531|nr:S8 family serine peptidase [Spongiactinospora sp. TRM90649]MDF5758953.1 S8 family serine peptidase [Spongiactinospora sp. TRM90649]
MSYPLRRRAGSRNLFRALVGLLAILCLSIPQVTAHAAPYREPGNDKISKAVQADLKDGKATFLVRLKGEADLSSARRANSKNAKAKAVYQAKTAHAKKSQAGLRELLAERKAKYTPFWIVNVIKVTADAKLAAEIAARPEVAGVDPIGKAELPKPLPGTAKAKLHAVEWNIDRINAPRVWNELGNRGEGVVVGLIDTGVDFEHPELAAQYRGALPDGRVVHDYNWFDPTSVCGGVTPCDNAGHGTHVTGTMVGKSGIGVAPAARWIAAKACPDDSGCDTDALLRSGQWMLAPTDANGENPRPDLAPDIINNSWGGEGFDPYYKPVTTAWVEAGIFPMFAIGNEGPGCGTAASPGMYEETYAASGFDVNGVTHPRFSTGTGENGEIKPNISAPGVDVRSSIPGGGYNTISGTSMASPHVAATVALIWSAAPALRRDIAATRQVLDGSAIDVADTSCGGTAADNNVYGEGRLDAYAAVQAAPDQALGTLAGTITSGGEPLPRAEVKVTGPLTREAATGTDGTYSIVRLPVGQYEVTVSRFGYDSEVRTVTVNDGQTTTVDAALTRRPHSVISGTITAGGGTEAGATVELAGTPARAVTDAAGHYQMTIPHGSHQLKVTAATRCTDPVTEQITVTGDLSRDADLPQRHDRFGYTCKGGTEPFVAGTEPLDLADNGYAKEVTMPFAVPLYGSASSRIWIGAKGYAAFEEPDSIFSNDPLPSVYPPDLAIYPFWDEMYFDEQSSVHTATVGTAPHRAFVIEWRNIAKSDAVHLTFSALLGEDGTISFRYKDAGEIRLDLGRSATIGIENADSTDALQYSYNTAAIRGGQSLTFTAAQHGLVTGTVTDANDGEPVVGSTVKVGQAATVTTGADGTFVGQVPAGNHTVEISKEHYTTATEPVTVAARATAGIGTVALATGHVTTSLNGLTVFAPAGATRQGTVPLTNAGSPADYTVTPEADQPGWLSVSPTTGRLAKNQSVTLTVTVSAAGLQPGEERSGKLVIRSASGRKPVTEVDVSVVVPR